MLEREFSKPKNSFFKTIAARLHGETSHKTPVSGMQSFSGLIGAYWTSEKWIEAWALSAVSVGLTALLAKNGVSLAESLGDLGAAFATFHDPHNSEPMQYAMHSVGQVGKYLGLTIGFNTARQYTLAHFHRNWRGFLNEKFTDAVLDEKDTHQKLMHHTRRDNPDVPSIAESLETVVQDSLKTATAGFTGLSIGLISIGFSGWFVGEKLLANSTVVQGMEALGSYGSFALGVATSAAYVIPGTYIAVKIGNVLQKYTEQINLHEGLYRGQWRDMSNNSFQISASGSQEIAKDVLGKSFDRINRTWAKKIGADTAFSAFNAVYNQFSANIFAYMPYILSYAQGTIGLKDFLTNATLTGAFTQSCSWLINVMPDIANMKASARLVTGLAQAIEEVQDTRDYYKKTGISNFEYAHQDWRKGLTLQNVKLMHAGNDAKPILQARNLNILPGQKVCVRGSSGCGKTTLFNTIAGKHAYGEGQISHPAGQEIAYLPQRAYLPPISLKGLVTMPYSAEKYTDYTVASLLETVGLGDLTGLMHDESRNGNLWGAQEGGLSGGQRQKLAIANLLLKKPDIALLDEPMSALDPQSKEEVQKLLDQHCKDMTIIVISHDEELPVKANGESFYDHELRISEGNASLHRISKRKNHLNLIGPDKQWEHRQERGRTPLLQ